MRIKLCIPGGIKSGPCQALFEHYLKLASKFAEPEFIAFRASPAEQDKAFLKLFQASRASHRKLTVLDERGKGYRSREFSSYIQKLTDSGTQEWWIACGGANGYGPEVHSIANDSWSLSPLTLPHELALVVATEQVFRAFSILNRHPYHND